MGAERHATGRPCNQQKNGSFLVNSSSFHLLPPHLARVSTVLACSYIWCLAESGGGRSYYRLVARIGPLLRPRSSEDTGVPCLNGCFSSGRARTSSLLAWSLALSCYPLVMAGALRGKCRQGGTNKRFSTTTTAMTRFGRELIMVVNFHHLSLSDARLFTIHRLSLYSVLEFSPV